MPPEIPVVEAALDRGVEVLDELEIGRRLLPTPIVGVTGPTPPTPVAEISSYQLEFAGEMRVEGAVFTNLSVDHLNRHGSMAAYGAAKRNLFVRGDKAEGLQIAHDGLLENIWDLQAESPTCTSTSPSPTSAPWPSGKGA